jgi:phenylpropionate dioxygenase-like ring-hydroxylating dioxygenase large terminal subunit
MTPGEDHLDLESSFGPEIDADFDGFDLANWRLSRDVVFDEPMNWKVVADGILDPYHPQFVHGETVAKYINNNVYLFDQLSVHTARLVMSKKTVVDADVSNLSENPAKYLFVNYLLLPNTFLVHQSRHFESWTIEPHPTDPGRSLTHIRILTSPTAFDSEQARETYVEENWKRFMHVAYEEDWGVARMVQTGVAGGAMTDTVVGRNEAPVHFLHDFIGRCIGDTIGLTPLLQH